MLQRSRDMACCIMSSTYKSRKCKAIHSECEPLVFWYSSQLMSVLHVMANAVACSVIDVQRLSSLCCSEILPR